MPEGNPEGYLNRELKERSGAPVIGPEQSALIRLLRAGINPEDSGLTQEEIILMLQQGSNLPDTINEERYNQQINRDNMNRVLKEQSGAEIAPAELDRLPGQASRRRTSDAQAEINRALKGISGAEVY